MIYATIYLQFLYTNALCIVIEAQFNLLGFFALLERSVKYNSKCIKCYLHK